MRQQQKTTPRLILDSSRVSNEIEKIVDDMGYRCSIERVPKEREDEDVAPILVTDKDVYNTPKKIKGYLKFLREVQAKPRPEEPRPRYND